MHIVSFGFVSTSKQFISFQFTFFFNRNYDFVIEITILLFFQKLEFLGSYTYSFLITSLGSQTVI